MFQGRLEVSEGPVWRHHGVELAAAVNTGNGPAPPTLIIRTGDQTWTIRRTHLDTTIARPISELAGNRFELSTGSQAPAVWTEDLSVRAMRRALTDHVGVGLGWSDRWRLANATARAIPFMVDLVTATNRYELRPRFEAVAYPTYPSPVSASVSSAAAGRLLVGGEVVGEGSPDFFQAMRPLPLEVALLASFLIATKAPGGA